MSFPASPTLESAPYGPQPVLPVIGPQGGPYLARGPAPQNALPSASRTATTTTAVQPNPGYSGIAVHFAVTANPGGAQTLQLTLNGVDPITGLGYPLLTVPASATPGGHWMLYPGLSGAPVEGVSLTRNLVLPGQWYVGVVHSGAGAWTYQVSVELLP